VEVELGKIVGVWGVKGWIKLHSYTRNRADIAEYKSWWLLPPQRSKNLPIDRSQAIQVDILNCREQGKGIVAQLDGVTDPDQALALNDRTIWVNKCDLPQLPDDEYYWQQLIGLQVSSSLSVNLAADNFEVDGDRLTSIGTIDSILETGANDVLVVKSLSGPDVLIPYIDSVVLDVDLKEGTMFVNWDPAFLID